MCFPPSFLPTKNTGEVWDNFEGLMYPFFRCLLMNFYTSSFLFLERGYTLALLALKSPLRSITWSYTFLTSILSDSTFPNTFSYLWNFLDTISSTFLWSTFISSSLPQSFFLSIAHLTIFFLSSLISFFLFILTAFPHSGGYLIILTSPFSQFISGLWAANHGIPKITSVFPNLQMSICTLSICFL